MAYAKSSNYSDPWVEILAPMENFAGMLTETDSDLNTPKAYMFAVFQHTSQFIDEAAVPRQAWIQMCMLISRMKQTNDIDDATAERLLHSLEELKAHVRTIANLRSYPSVVFVNLCYTL
ncbi:hypothetical protein ONZ45_g4784 [Pleurotus djamor]|nr:hypothetical protein ONZ45_g4784 [Pleurotus djamor]